MKKIIIFSAFLFVTANLQAQTDNTQLQAAVARLDNARSEKDYQQLASDFLRIANAQKTQWLPYYYAGLCNAMVGWLKQNTDPDDIETFADRAEEAINKAQTLVDTSTQKKALSEIYCVQMMLNQARVYINPQTYGPKYGPTAFGYIEKAKMADADNPRMLYLAGWQKFATPKMFGGDKMLAKQLLSKAKEKLAAQSSGSIEPHWGMKEVDELLKQIR